MTIQEIQTTVDKIGVAFEELKAANNDRLAEIEKKGSADVLLENKLETINTYINDQQELKERIEKLETTSSIDVSDSVSKEADSEYKEAFLRYIKKGYEGPALEEKALSVGNDTEGGYTVTAELSGRIIERLFETSPMRSICNVQTISSDALDMIQDDASAASGGWAGEQTARVVTASPTIGRKSIPAHELYAMPQATPKLLDDSSWDAEAWLGKKIGDILGRNENTAFIVGTGANQPRGITTYPNGNVTNSIEQVASASGQAGIVTSNDIVNLYYTLLPEYARNSTYIMARATEQVVRTLVDQNGQYMWQPAFTREETPTLMGRPIVQCSDMPAIGANSLSIAVGDFNEGYTIVDRTGLRVLRDAYSNKPFIDFYATKRTGGDVTNFQAIKLLILDA
jgi:HK97 family phage major capsid protein